MYDFEELDKKTRQYMLNEFRKEEAGKPYRSPRLSEIGLCVFNKEVEQAIISGNELILSVALNKPEYWNESEMGRSKLGKEFPRSINAQHASEFLANTEFNTWYVRGLSRRLLDEGVKNCQIYRAAPAIEPRGECVEHEDQIYPVKDIYDGHRLNYWPEVKVDKVLSIPIGTNCHHTIRRVENT